MAEAFGLAASIVQLAGTGVKLSKTLYDYASSASRASQEIVDIAGDVDITANALENVRMVFENEESKSIVTQEAIKHATGLIKRCEEVYNDIYELTKKGLKGAQNGKRLGTMAKLAWPFREPKVQLQRGRLESLKNSLVLFINVIQLANAQARGSSEKILVEEREKIRQLHQREQESLMKVENLRLRIKELSTEDDDTLKGSDSASAEGIISFATLQCPVVPASGKNDSNPLNATKSTLKQDKNDDTHSTDSDESISSDETEKLNEDVLLDCLKHAEKLLRKISALQRTFDATETKRKPSRRRMLKIYRRFCNDFETGIKTVDNEPSSLPPPECNDFLYNGGSQLEQHCESGIADMIDKVKKGRTRSANLWAEPSYYSNFVSNMYPTGSSSSLPTTDNPLPEDDEVNQQMALLLMKNNSGPSPDTSSATFRIDLPEDEEERKQNQAPVIGDQRTHSRATTREERRREIELGYLGRSDVNSLTPTSKAPAIHRSTPSMRPRTRLEGPVRLGKEWDATPSDEKDMLDSSVGVGHSDIDLSKRGELGDSNANSIPTSSTRTKAPSFDPTPSPTFGSADANANPFSGTQAAPIPIPAYVPPTYDPLPIPDEYMVDGPINTMMIRPNQAPSALFKPIEADDPNVQDPSSSTDNQPTPQSEIARKSSLNAGSYSNDDNDPPRRRPRRSAPATSEIDADAHYDIRLTRRNEARDREARRQARQQARAQGDQNAVAELRRQAGAGKRRISQMLVGEHTMLVRQRSMSSVQYGELGVARSDGTRVTVNAGDDNRPLLDSAASISSVHNRSGIALDYGDMENTDLPHNEAQGESERVIIPSLQTDTGSLPFAQGIHGSSLPAPPILRSGSMDLIRQDSCRSGLEEVVRQDSCRLSSHRSTLWKRSRDNDSVEPIIRQDRVKRIRKTGPTRPDSPKTVDEGNAPAGKEKRVPGDIVDFLLEQWTRPVVPVNAGEDFMG